MLHTQFQKKSWDASNRHVCAHTLHHNIEEGGGGEVFHQRVADPLAKCKRHAVVFADRLETEPWQTSN
jgi:hypothetical protein